MSSIILDDLINKLEDYDENDIEIIKKAYKYAEDLHEGQFRQSGEPYVSYRLNVAYILAEMHTDKDTICARLSHDTMEDTNITKEGDYIVWRLFKKQISCFKV